MPDLVDRLSDNDDAERKRVAKVAARNSMVFGSLTKAVKDNCSRYNERHPQEHWAPNALIATDAWVSTAFSLEIKKTTQPVSSLKVDFPINSGAMQFSATNGEKGIITLDLTDDDGPIYYMDEKAHSVDEAGDFLLSLLFPETPPTPKNKIGFNPA